MKKQLLLLSVSIQEVCRWAVRPTNVPDDALQLTPGAGGVTASNAQAYIDAGASHVIVTSFVFNHGRIDMDRLHELVRVVGRERLVRAVVDAA